MASGILFGAASVLVFVLDPKFGLLPLAGFFRVLYFFRDPERKVPAGEEKILAPADGRVKDVSQVVEKDFLGRSAMRIGITLSMLNVHLNRTPCTGEVEFLKYTPGKFHNALGSKASADNENNLIGIRSTFFGKGIAVKQIAGAVARRIVCDCRLEEKVENGQRIGMIKFGSRTEIFIPTDLDFKLLVKPGGKVKAGQTVIGIVRREK